jgi:hypothetical protein
MIKVDVSKVIPPRLATYLLGAIPGLFFEVSVAVGDPQYAALLISRLRGVYPFGPYALLVLLLASGLLIGQGFVVMAWMADLLITYSIPLWHYAFRITLGSDWLYRYAAKLQGTAPKPKGFAHSLMRLTSWARWREFSSGAKPVLKCLHVATRQLLKVRYGIERTAYRWQPDDGEWGVWYSALGKPLKGFQEASLASRIFFACGFAGFAARHASPSLRMSYFSALCFVFTVAGGYMCLDLARWRINPVRRSTERLRSVLLELSEVSNKTEKKHESVTVAIDANEE